MSKTREYPDNTFISALRKARTEFGMALIRMGADIAMKNSESLKLYVKHNSKLELLGELEKNKK